MKIFGIGTNGVAMDNVDKKDHTVNMEEMTIIHTVGLDHTRGMS